MELKSPIRAVLGRLRKAIWWRSTACWSCRDLRRWGQPRSSWRCATRRKHRGKWPGRRQPVSRSYPRWNSPRLALFRAPPALWSLSELLLSVLMSLVSVSLVSVSLVLLSSVLLSSCWRVSASLVSSSLPALVLLQQVLLWRDLSLLLSSSELIESVLLQ